MVLAFPFSFFFPFQNRNAEAFEVNYRSGLVPCTAIDVTSQEDSKISCLSRQQLLAEWATQN